MSTKRVFANNNTINFNDYLKNKNGIEIIKNIKSKPHYNKNINIFFSYEKFILLTKAFFHSFLKSPFQIQIPVDIYNSNISFIVYKSMLSHIKDCIQCNECKYDKDIIKIGECDKIKGILYPYGKYIEFNTTPNILIHKRINLDDACKELYCNTVNDNSANDNTINDILLDSKNEVVEMFPSQNDFVFQNIQNKNQNQLERMNAYATYPNIKKCYKKIQPSTIADIVEDLPNSSMKSSSSQTSNHNHLHLRLHQKKSHNEMKTQTTNIPDCGCSKNNLCKKTRPLFID